MSISFKQFLIEDNRFFITHLLDINKVAPHMGGAGININAETLSTFLNKSEDEIKKVLSWSEKEKATKHKIEKEPKQKFSPDVHKAILTLIWFKYHKDEPKNLDKYNEVFEAVKGKYGQFVDVASKHEEEIKKYIPGFKASWLPVKEIEWKDVPHNEKISLLKHAVTTLANGKPKSVTAEMISRFLKDEKHIIADRRPLDRMLSDEKELMTLDKFRVLGKGSHG